MLVRQKQNSEQDLIVKKAYIGAIKKRKVSPQRFH